MSAQQPAECWKEPSGGRLFASEWVVERLGSWRLAGA
jgi:hypothetical protein